MSGEIMNERRYWFVIDKGKLEYVQDNVTKEKITVSELEDLLNEQQDKISELEEELERSSAFIIEQRKENKKLSEVTNNLADEVKKNGLLNEEINQLRIENMRLNKKVDLKMTRFKYVWENISDPAIYDNITGNYYFMNDEGDIERIVELLNNFYQENQQLNMSPRCNPNEIESMVKEIYCLKDKCKQLEQQYHNLVDAIVKTHNDLGKENIYLDICKRITEYERELSGDGV